MGVPMLERLWVAIQNAQGTEAQDLWMDNTRQQELVDEAYKDKLLPSQLRDLEEWQKPDMANTTDKPNPPGIPKFFTLYTKKARVENEKQPIKKKNILQDGGTSTEIRDTKNRILKMLGGRQSIH